MRWTLVTGAAKGLGRAIALKLSLAGHHVVVHYDTSEQDAYQLVQTIRTSGFQAEMIQGDFSSLPGVKSFISRYLESFPQTRALVNNVGLYLKGSALTTSEEDWTALFQVNFHAPLAITQAILPTLQTPYGAIVNIGLAGMERRPFTSCAAYSITKNAFWMLTRTLALELAPQQIRVNMVSPGHLENSVDPISVQDAVPMGRLGTLEEVARAVVFLLEEGSHYITGQNVEVAGGVRL